MKQASIYLRKGVVFAETMCRTDAGVFIADGPTIVVTETRPHEIGRAVLSALDRSRPVPHPSAFGHETVLRPLLHAAGVKSWSTFVKGASTVSVSSDDAAITVTPMDNLGARDGFEEREGEDRVLPMSTPPEEIGRIVAEMLQRPPSGDREPSPLF